MGVLLWMDTIHFAPLGNTMAETIFHWYLQGDRIMSGFLRWCEMEFVHPQYGEESLTNHLRAWGPWGGGGVYSLIGYLRPHEGVKRHRFKNDSKGGSDPMIRPAAGTLGMYVWVPFRGLTMTSESPGAAQGLVPHGPPKPRNGSHGAGLPGRTPSFLTHAHIRIRVHMFLQVIYIYIYIYIIYKYTYIYIYVCVSHIYIYIHV